VANPRRARTELGWKPEVDFRGLVRMMVEADVALVSREQTRDPEERRLMVAAPVLNTR
jgi:GDPmannose 4,6-dehydratase